MQKSLAFNVLTAGNANGSAKSATNAIADSAEDGVRREAKDSYVARVELTGDTYFSLGKRWNDIKAYRLTDDDMFHLFNTRELDDAVAQGKTIRFSQNPLDWKDTALWSEWEYLKSEHGYTDLKTNGGYWYGVK